MKKIFKRRLRIQFLSVQVKYNSTPGVAHPLTQTNPLIFGTHLQVRNWHLMTTSSVVCSGQCCEIERFQQRFRPSLRWA